MVCGATREGGPWRQVLAAGLLLAGFALAPSSAAIASDEARFSHRNGDLRFVPPRGSRPDFGYGHAYPQKQRTIRRRHPGSGTVTPGRRIKRHSPDYSGAVCRQVNKIEHDVNGRPRLTARTVCRDGSGKSYVVPRSRKVIKRY
jgi:hypothetical protein